MSITLPPPQTSPIITILSASSLLTPPNSHHLPHLNALLNDAYETHGHPSRHTPHIPGPLFTDLRITTPTALIEELGPSGLIALCTDPSTAHPDYGPLIATAALKPFKGKTVTLFLRALEDIKSSSSTADINETLTNAESEHKAVDIHLLNDLALARATSKLTPAELTAYARTENWEITTCASVNDPRYRGKGLVGKCLEALVVEVLRRRDDAASAQAEGEGKEGARKPVKLWSTALGGSGNAEYWVRRGFEAEGEAERAPVGLWSATRELEILTLGKIVG